ncbi:Rho GTPase [Serendipita sp. 399]|nr:Rho GTPase [Serendipita sp. 399]
MLYGEKLSPSAGKAWDIYPLANALREWQEEAENRAPTRIVSRGQEEYERLRPLSYSKSHVVLIAFAIDTPDSLENVTVKWNEEVRSICGPAIPVILVGLKSDLRPPPGHPDIDQYVSREKGEEVAQQIGARAYKECSALRIQGVDDVFEVATRASLLVRDNQAPRARKSESDGYGGPKSSDSYKSGCCVVC